MKTKQSNETVYEQLERNVLPLLEAYHADLTTHDRNWLAENPGVPFLHYTRSTGTTIVPLYGSDDFWFPPSGTSVPYLFGVATRDHLLGETRKTVKRHASEASRYTCNYYDGRSLRTIPVDKAIAIVDHYVRRIQTEWDRQARQSASAR